MSSMRSGIKMSVVILDLVQNLYYNFYKNTLEPISLKSIIFPGHISLTEDYILSYSISGIYFQYNLKMHSFKLLLKGEEEVS